MMILDSSLLFGPPCIHAHFALLHSFRTFPTKMVLQ